MAGHPYRNYLVRELDPVLLSEPFKLLTNWNVITGAPCSGKTTLIDLFVGLGYETASETAREYFEKEMAKGRTSQEIRDRGAQTQFGIFELQRQLEDGLLPQEVIFLDRGLPDSLTFHRLFNLNPDELLPGCHLHRYASVFVLDRLPFEREIQLGPEDEKSAQFVDEWLERDYTALGYEVVRVPVLTAQERLGFILERLPNSMIN